MVTYDKEFKEQAVKMAAELSPGKTARDLGIPVNTLYTWISKAKKHGEYAHVGSGHSVKIQPAVKCPHFLSATGNSNEQTKYLKKRWVFLL